MKVILLQDVRKLGKNGDIIEVAEGYARNYLLPRGLAVEATKGKLKELSEQKKADDRKKKQLEQEAKDLAERLNQINVELTVKTGEGGRLFGAINNKDIADYLKEQHSVNIDKKKIVLKAPIKNLGEYKVAVKLHPKVQAELNVKVLQA